MNEVVFTFRVTTPGSMRDGCHCCPRQLTTLLARPDIVTLARSSCLQGYQHSSTLLSSNFSPAPQHHPTSLLPHGQSTSHTASITELPTFCSVGNRRNACFSDPRSRTDVLQRYTYQPRARLSCPHPLEGDHKPRQRPCPDKRSR